MSLGLVSAGVSALASIAGGISARRTARLNAFNLGTERVLNEAEATQQSNMRMEAYRSNLSSNIATFAAAGREVGLDRSVGAFLGKQKEVVGEDIKNMEFMKMMRSMKLTSQAHAAVREGRDAQTASYINAFTTMADGISKFNSTKIPPTT